MRKWGLYFSCLLVLVVMLTGCGAGDSDSAADKSAATTEDLAFSTQDKAETAVTANNSSADSSTPAESAPLAGGSGNPAVKGTTAANTDSATAGFTGSDVVAGLNKKLIYRANLNMEVEDYGKAQTEVRNMVTMAHGYIIEFNENMTDYEQGGTFILKVPASGFSSFLSNLEKVKHETLQRSIQGTDVSEEYVDLESRLKAKQLMEIQYTEFMKRAANSSDLVAFANELGAIQESIEQIKGRMRYIDQNVSFSTVELRLYQTDETTSAKQKTEQGPLFERASEALSGSLNALSVMFQWLFVFLAGALPLLIGGGIILVIVLMVRKNGRRHRDQQSRLLPRSNRELSGDEAARMPVNPNPVKSADNEESEAESEEEK